MREPDRFLSMALIRAVVVALAGALTLAGGITVAFVPLASAQAVAPLQIYLSPSGDDTNDGLTPATARKTLDGAEDVLKSRVVTTDVEIRIASGEYRVGKTSWDTYLTGHKISFMPLDYTCCSSGYTGSRPVFHGPTGNTPADRSAGVSWFNAATPPRATVEDEGLHFYYLEVRNYSSGMSFSGDTMIDTTTKLRRPGARRNDHNSLFGMKFHHLGDRHNWNGSALTTIQPGETWWRGTHAVALTNSSHNTFENSHYLYLEGVEDPGTTGLDVEIIHAFYVKDGSAENVITKSNFSVISGAPVKVRNDANRTDVTNNRFTRAGPVSDGIFYDRIENYPCNTSNPSTPTNCDSTHSHFECPSHGNELLHNTVEGGIVVNGELTPVGYVSGRRIPWFARSPYSPSETGPAGCSNSGDTFWLRTGGTNTVEP